MASLIIRLEADADWAAPLGSIVVTCVASSPDGGDLSYEWSASGGNITERGAQATWTAPEEVGMYDITVVVTDDQGKKDTASLALIASNGPPPVIDALIVTAVGHEYLKESSVGYKVAKTYDYGIECDASSNTSGEMVYDWSCTSGNISGEGSVITWTAPDTEGRVTVTVKVFDELSNWVKKSVILDVVRCAGCVTW